MTNTLQSSVKLPAVDDFHKANHCPSQVHLTEQVLERLELASEPLVVEAKRIFTFFHGWSFRLKEAVAVAVTGWSETWPVLAFP